MGFERHVWFSPNRVAGLRGGIFVSSSQEGIGCTKSFQRRLSRASCLKTRPNPGFIWVWWIFQKSHSIHVCFFLNIALHENNSTKIQHISCFSPWMRICGFPVAEPKLLPGGFGSHHVGQPWLRWSEFH